MALYLLEGFETYGTGGIAGANLEAAIGQIWSKPDGITYGTDCTIVTPGRGGIGACLKMPHRGSNYILHHCGVQKQTWTVGFAVYMPRGSQAYSSYHLYTALDNADLAQITLRLGTADNLRVWIGHSGGGAYMDQESVTGSFRTGQWNYVEMQFTIHSSTGSYEVRVNGVTILSASGMDTDYTGSGEASQHYWAANATDQQLDDIYICDDSGAEFNDWLGDNFTVFGLTPSADTAQLDWSAQPAISHYLNMDEDGGNDNNDYVYDNSAGNEDLYEYDNLPITPSDILLIDIWTQAALDIAGSESVIITCQSGATHDSGSTETVTDTTYTTVHRQLSQDPNTAAAWTEAGLNAAQFGVEIG